MGDREKRRLDDVFTGVSNNDRTEVCRIDYNRRIGVGYPYVPIDLSHADVDVCCPEAWIKA
jgi:hypothetical protein